MSYNLMGDGVWISRHRTQVDGPMSHNLTGLEWKSLVGFGWEIEINIDMGAS